MLLTKKYYFIFIYFVNLKLPSNFKMILSFLPYKILESACKICYYKRFTNSTVSKSNFIKI